jgi:hypothetical protein
MRSPPLAPGFDFKTYLVLGDLGMAASIGKSRSRQLPRGVGIEIPDALESGQPSCMRCDVGHSMAHGKDADYSVERIPTPNPARFEPDISPSEWVASVRASGITLPPIWNQPFEVLQPAHLVGRARTNATLIDPTIVQTDVLAPLAASAGRISLRPSAQRYSTVTF